MSRQDVTDADLRRWVDYLAAGLTNPVAEAWRAQGYPGIAAAAVAAGATRAEVYQLAPAAILRAGDPDGQTRPH